MTVLKAHSPDGFNMTLDSGHPGFDAATGILTPSDGYRVDNKRVSHPVHSAADCDDSRWPLPGQRQDWDLDKFFDLPKDVADRIRTATVSSTIILNEIRHYDSQGERFLHGYIVSRDQSQGYELLEKFCCDEDERSRAVVDTCVFYLTDVPYIEARVGRQPRARLSGLTA